MKTTINTKCTPGQTRAALPAHVPLRRPANDGLGNHLSGRGAYEVPHVLHIDADKATALQMSILLSPEARVTSVTTLAQARALLSNEVFALIVMDPTHLKGEAAALRTAMGGTRLLVYSVTAPEWHAAPGAYLAKPWTSARQLWTTVAGMLGIPANMKLGD